MIKIEMQLSREEVRKKPLEGMNLRKIYSTYTMYLYKNVPNLIVKFG